MTQTNTPSDIDVRLRKTLAAVGRESRDEVDISARAYATNAGWMRAIGLSMEWGSAAVGSLSAGLGAMHAIHRSLGTQPVRTSRIGLSGSIGFLVASSSVWLLQTQHVSPLAIGAKQQRLAMQLEGIRDHMDVFLEVQVHNPALPLIELQKEWVAIVEKKTEIKQLCDHPPWYILWKNEKGELEGRNKKTQEKRDALIDTNGH